MTSQRRTATARDRWIVLAIFIVAFGVRLVYLVNIEAYPKFELIKNRLDDQVVFDAWAKALAAGEAFDYRTTGHEFAHWVAADPGVYPQAPLYPFVVGAFYALVGPEYDGFRVVQMAFGALACVLLFRLARRFMGPPLAAAVSLGLAFYGPQVFYESTLLRAGLFTVVALLGLTLTYALQDRLEDTSNTDSNDPEDGSPSLWRFCALAWVTGVVLALGVLMRPNYLLFALLAIAWLAWLARGANLGRRTELRRRTVIWMGLGLVLPLLPIIALNTWRSGHAAFLSSNGPYIFFLSNVHDTSGISAGPSPYYFEVKAQGSASEVDLMAEAWRDIRNFPGRYFALQGRKFLAFFSPQETPNNLSFEMARKTNPLLDLAAVRLHWVLPLAVLGLCFTRRRQHVLLHLLLWSYTGSTVLFYVLARLRLPVVPVLLLFAGLALDGLWRVWRDGGTGRRLGAAGALLATLAASFVLAPRDVLHRPADYAMAAAATFSLAQETEARGDFETASRHYGRAVALNPQHREALARFQQLPASPSQHRDGQQAAALGQQVARLTQDQDFAAARSLLHLACAEAPRWATPYQFLSNVAYLQGDQAMAMAYLEEAVARDPLQPLYRHNLETLRREALAAHGR